MKKPYNIKRLGKRTLADEMGVAKAEEAEAAERLSDLKDEFKRRGYTSARGTLFDVSQGDNYVRETGDFDKLLATHHKLLKSLGRRTKLETLRKTFMKEGLCAGKFSITSKSANTKAAA